MDDVRNPKILIISNPGHAEIISQIIELSPANFKYTHITDIRQALAEVQSSKYNLVFLYGLRLDKDYTLESGLSILLASKANPETPSLVFVASDEEGKQATKWGAGRVIQDARLESIAKEIAALDTTF